MILIQKPTKIPKILTTRGIKETKKNKLACNGGEIDFDIKGNIYGAPSVKRALKKAQHKKCCYCEKDQGDEYGAVEHYRPKGGFNRERGQPLTKPSYYWLGYEWSNLFFVCGPCNTTHKGNLFPLVDEANRAYSHNNNYKNEKPLVLNPCGRKDPANHITFDKQLVKPKKGSIFGKKTIDVCGLYRETLNDKRKEILNEIEDRILILLDPDSSVNQIKRAKTYIKKRMEPQAEFSSAATCYIKSFKNIVIT